RGALRAGHETKHRLRRLCLRTDRRKKLARARQRAQTRGIAAAGWADSPRSGADEKETAMRNDLLRTSALALAFVVSVGLAAAQQQPPAAGPQQQSQQEKAQQTPSGKMGAEEPSSRAPNAAAPANAAFVNGALAVPDAPANTDTVPAKFSA